MTNLEIAKLLRKMSAAYTILGENRFKVIAYDNAATTVEHATSELKDLWDDGQLASVPGLGPSIISHLDELFRTGKSCHFDQILKKINPAVFEFLEIPGIGPKKAQKLTEELKINDPKRAVEMLKNAALKHKIAVLENFGAKSEQDILESIDRFKKGAIKEKRMVLPQADLIAEEIITHLKSRLGPKISRVDKLGSLRRQVATIGDIDLAVATNNAGAVIEAFVTFPKKVNLIEKGPTGTSILLASGRQADLRVAKPQEYGAMLQYFTGSKYHNIKLRDFALKKGLSLNEYGIKPINQKLKVKSPALPAGKQNYNSKLKIYQFSKEEDFYQFLGLDDIPPELREDTGEIEAAFLHRLPKLVDPNDIHGDLHLHANFDQETSHDPGTNSIEEIRQAGEKLGYDYVGMTDHNPSSSKHTKAEIITKIRKQKQEIEHINSTTKNTRILSLLEIDISPDGTLPIPDGALELLDGCLVAIHSNFAIDKESMTKRVLAGLSNPAARIFAHPTGRLLEEREGYELDWEKVFAFCQEHDKALEINAYPNRLDLPDTLVREAVKRGVKLSLGTDAHRIEDMALMKYGVGVARRGWAEKKNIINTWPYDRILNWMHERR